MIGQEVIPQKPIMPERVANRSELRQWDELLDNISECTDRLLICRWLGKNASVTRDFAKIKGVPFPFDLNAIGTRVMTVQKELNELKSLVRRVEDHELALQFTPKDINIVDPSRQNLDGVILIAAGVVLLIGAISASGYLLAELLDAEKELRIVHTAMNREFCDDPNSDKCQQWQDHKIEAGYEERKSWVDEMTDAIKEPLATGGKWGLAAGIPLLILMLLWNKK